MENTAEYKENLFIFITMSADILFHFFAVRTACKFICYFIKIKPADLVEKDYYRKLAFCYEIKFNEL